MIKNTDGYIFQSQEYFLNDKFIGMNDFIFIFIIVATIELC